MTLPRVIPGHDDNAPTRSQPGRPKAPLDVRKAIRRARRRWRHRWTKPVLPGTGNRRRRFVRGLVRSPILRVVVALFVAVQVRDRYREVLAEKAAWGASVRVPVMASSRPAGFVLRKADVVWNTVPRSAAPAEMPQRVSEVVGRRLVSSIAAGEFVSATRLSKGPSSSLRARIGEGRYAVTISLRENRPRVSVGDEVDVIDAAGRPASSRSVVVQNDTESVTLSVTSEELRLLSAALAGPVLLAVRGEDVQPSG